MKQNLKKRGLALALSVCLLCNMSLPTAAAPPEHTGLCEHHPVHTAECGYREGTAGTPCSHKVNDSGAKREDPLGGGHTQDCYKEVTECLHEHTDECYSESDSSVSDSEATPSNGKQLDLTECPHICGEDTGCITKVLDCPHEHKVNGGDADREGGLDGDADCGYAEATEGTPCGYVCDECEAEPEEDSSDLIIGAGSITITAFDELEETVREQAVPAGTELPALNLPKALAATGYAVDDNTTESDTGTPSDAAPVTTPAAITIEGVTWELDPENEINAGNSTYDPAQGTYCFTPVLPEGYTLAEGVSLPEIWVMAGMVNVLAGETGDFTVIGGNNGTDYKYENDTLTILTGTPITISGTTTRDKIAVASTVMGNITLDGVKIDVSGTNGACAIDMQNAGVCTITLAEGSINSLLSGNDRPGIFVPATNKLTIQGRGELEAHGGNAWPGIGRIGGSGNIEIQSGTIRAFGGNGAAGIGGSYFYSGGIITIKGGSITANGSDGGAGIGGGGAAGGSVQNEGGTITITGGTVTANSSNGGGAGIGGGYCGNGGTIAITGGTVTANSSGGAGIGGGNRGNNGGTITITGGTVTANGSNGSAGIGGSVFGNSGVIKISNAVVSATGDISSGAEHIGHGSRATPPAPPTTPNIENSLVIKGDIGEVTGDANIIDDFTIGNHVTVTIGSGTSLTVESGATLTNEGTITVESGGTLAVENGGILNQAGALNGAGTKPDEGSYNHTKSKVTLTVAPSPAVYGDTITLTAAVAEQANSLSRSAIPQKTVVFYCDGQAIGDPVPVAGNQAQKTIALKTSEWKPGQYTLSVQYSGGNNNLLPSASSPVTLTVSKVTTTQPDAPTQNGASADTTITLNTVDGQKYIWTTGAISPTTGVGDWLTATEATYQFTGLTQNTDYYFWTYIPGDDYYEDSPVSPAIKITTDKSSDQLLVDTVKEIIENGSYTMAQATANTAETVKTELARQINALSGIGDTGITVTADNITLHPFTAAQEGDGNNRPGTDGSFSFTVSLTKGSAAATTIKKTGAVTATRYEKPIIATTSLPDGALGTSYSQTLTADGDDKIVTWSVTSGNLPDGLRLEESSGKISGTPAKAGDFTFTVKATNDSGNHSRELSIHIPLAAPIVVWPTASLTYGKTLADAALAGGSATGVGNETVYGTFTWENESTAPAVPDSGTTNYKMTFTPDGANAENYKAVTNSDMTVTVEPKELTLVLTADPTPGTAKQDVTLTATLTGAVGDDIPGGTITFKRGDVGIKNGAAISKNGRITATATWSSVNGGSYDLTAEYIPAVSDNYKGGNTGTLNGYTVNKATPVVTAPIANTNLAYTGEAQELVKAGSTTGGTLKYSTDNQNWSDEIPTGTDATSYTIYYKVAGNDNYTNVEAESVSVNITPKDIRGATITLGDNLAYTGKEQSQTVSGVKISGLTVPFSDYTVSDNTGTGAGDYTLKVTITKQGSNFTGTESRDFSIAQAQNSITGLKCDDLVYGGTPAPSAFASFGLPSYAYSRSEMGPFSTWTADNSVGTWYVKASVEATKDYAEAATAPVAFEVTQKQEETPEAGIDYMREILTNLTANARYSITPEGGTTVEVTAADGAIAIQEAWFGKALSVAKAARNGNYSVSKPQRMTLSARPATPAALLQLTKTADSITITNTVKYPGCEFSIDGISWNSTGAFTSLTAGTAYMVQVRVMATGQAPKSDSMKQAITTMEPDGSTALKPGETVEKGDTTICNDGTKTTITGDKTIIITPPATGGDMNIDKDGNVEIPENGKVQTNQGPAATVGPGNGGKADKDGNITLPENGKVQIGTNPVTTITAPPTGGGEISIDEDGNMKVPTGFTVQTGTNPGTTLPDGGGMVDPATGEVRYTVTFDSRGGTAVDSLTVAAGGRVAKPAAPTKNDHTFGGWYKEETCQNPWAFNTDTVTGSITLYAKWMKDQSSSGDDSPDSSMSISIWQVMDAINQATADNLKNGTIQNGVSVTVNLPAGVTGATLSREAYDKLITSGVISFQLNFSSMSMAFDRAALLEIQKQTTGSVTISAVQVSGLSGEALAAIGRRPAYKLSVSWQRDGIKAEVTNVGVGRVTLALAYPPATGESVAGLYLVQAEQNGAAVWTGQSSYNSDTKLLSGYINHLSMIYGVGYQAPPAFADTANH